MSSNADKAEVSTKIRAAIKAKLEELGVYVDSELPDYIMVMIANKKDQSQMKEDLTLFLGKNTTKFVEWLFDIFAKLQNASAASAAAAVKPKEDVEEIKRREREKEKEREREKERVYEREKEREREREKEKERERDRERRERERERDRERERERRREKEEEDRRRGTNSTQDLQSNAAEARRAERKTIVFDAGEESSRARKDSDRNRSRRRDEGRSRESERRRISPPKRRSRSNTWSDDERARRRAAVPVHESDEDEASDKKVASAVVAKKGAPVTITEDPRPKVSSVVVGKRKIPKPGDEKEARVRSSMFMKAMLEASASAGYGPSKKTVPTTTRQSRIGKRVIRLDDERMGDEIDLEYEDEVVEEEEEVVEEEDAEMDEDEENSGIVVSPTKQVSDNTKFIITLGGVAGRVTSAATKRRTEPRAERKRRMPLDNVRAHLFDAKKATDTDGEKREKRKKTSVRVTRIISSEGPNEKRRRSESPLCVSPPPKQRISAPSPERKTPKVWDGKIDIDPESSDDEARIDEVLAETRISPSASEAMSEVPPTPQLSRPYVWHAASTTENQNQYQPQPLQQIQQPQQYIPTPISAGHPQGGAAPQKVLERCRYWPNCQLDNDCKYVHPMKPCMNFPKCKYGDRCLYVHPMCRFDTVCTNPMCTFVHSKGARPATTFKAPAPMEITESKADVPLSAEPPTKIVPETLALPTCRYGNKCKNATCNFKHPPLCRFGPSCTNSFCHFWHPTQKTTAPKKFTGRSGGPAAYKWTATAAPPVPTPPAPAEV